MKKIAVLVTVAFLTIGTCFADTFAGGEKIAENFLTNGTYIKFIVDDNNTSYIYKSSGIFRIRLDEDDFRILYFDGKEDVYEISRYNISNDANGNIIISKKSKKK